MNKTDQSQDLFNNDLNLEGIFLFFKESIKQIIISASIFSCIGVLYSLSLEDKFTSVATVLPGSLDESRSLGGLSAISGLTGVNLSGNGIKVLIAKETINSKKFLNSFLEKEMNSQHVIAVKEWDREKKEIIFDLEVYDPVKETWTYRNKINSELGPTSGELRDAFLSNFSAIEDEETQVFKLSFTHLSPNLAKQILENYISTLNESVKEDDLRDSQERYDYLKTKFSETNIVTIQKNISALMSEELKMLSTLRNKDYAFKVIDPPNLPEKKSGPFRSVICILFGIVGIFLGIFFSLFKRYFS
tara:strand:- start:423 stop:1331 length:909 start_codon:yes stop_codon:yes gene_type:complete